jgi:glutaredoxin
VLKVRVLTSLGCTPCLRVKRIVEELQAEMPNLTVEEVEYTSPDGSKLAMEKGVLYPPAVFLNEQLIAKGKIDRDMLVAQIRNANEMTA